MRKITTVVLALGLIGVLAVGCGATSEKTVASKLGTQAQKLDATNYKSVATMTVQMGDSSQSYYVETWYDSPNQYRIALGDTNKNIHQIIVHNANGMFVVSPSLGKVFRFNGNWAQNQGHIYLYDQVLQQIASAKDVKMTKSGDNYSFELPIQQASDVVVKQRVQMNSKTFAPESVTLLDKDSHAVVTLTYKSFDTNVSFKNTDFNPESVIQDLKPTKATMSSGEDLSVGYIDADAKSIGSTLSTVLEKSKTDTMLRYTGEHGFTLEEFRPSSGVDGLPDDSSVVDLFGVPAIYTGDSAHQLIWLNNGVEFALTSNNMTLDQMQSVALTTFGQVGK